MSDQTGASPATGRRPRPKNIQPAELCLGWDSTDARRASIADLKHYAEREAAGAINWYWEKKVAKARASKLVRWSAIILTGLAGLFPIAKNAWPNAFPSLLSGSLAWMQPSNPDLLVSLFVGLAATLVALDRFGGFSTAWIRYVRTATDLQRLLCEFRMDWAMLESRMKSVEDQSAVDAMIARVKELVATVRADVLQETQQWAAEFESSLAQMEKDVQVRRAEREQVEAKRRETDRPGSISLAITNPDAISGETFTVTVCGETGEILQETTARRAHWSRLGIRPGHYLIRIEANSAGRTVTSETPAFEVLPGRIAEVAVTLPKSAAA
jgi:hypothetical protein